MANDARPSDSLSKALRLWLRLALLGSTAGVFLVFMVTLPWLGSWPLSYTHADMVQAGIASFLMGALGGASLGSLLALFLVPLTLVYPRFSAVSGVGATLATGVMCSVVLVDGLVLWLRVMLRLKINNFQALVFSLACISLILAFLYLRPRIRTNIIAELDSAFTGRVTRRLILSGAAASVVALAIDTPSIVGKPQTPRGGKGRPNILLVTFDALGAEDMSLYGSLRNTTPNIDAFARTGAVFQNFYGASTFTTPCVAAIETGCYPSTTRMVHLKDRFRGDAPARTLMRRLREAGYRTGASFNNPWAHPGRTGLGSEFDLLPPPAAFSDVFPEWAARQPFLDVLDYTATDILFARERMQMFFPHLFPSILPTFDAQASFHQAEEVMRRLDGGPNFTWVHIFAPHFPYSPAPPYLHRYLAGDAMRGNFEYWHIGGRYPAALQGAVDQARARYDEFLAQTDAQFGAFMERIRARLDDTIVVVSADHGECFSGGFWTHGSPAQYRPNIHIPLIVRRPQDGAHMRVGRVADQTALAPTILAAAGLDIPHWMEGTSLLPAINGQDDNGGLAFTQHLDANSAFGPFTQGTLGVVDGRYQYVLDIATRTGRLFLLSQAHLQDEDLSRFEPEQAARLLTAIRARFPQFRGI